MRYADDFVVMCDTAEACEEAERVVRAILDGLGLELHPEKTRRVELTSGKEGFDFLGCHLRKRMSGRLWEQYGRRGYYLQRWPAARALKRLRQRVRELVGRHRNGVKDVRVLIRDLNPVLRGWGSSFGNGPLPGSQMMPSPERSPASRVRENRKHGSKGGPTATLHQEVK